MISIYIYICSVFLLDYKATWRQYNVRETTERTRNIKVYCYNCAGNHLGKVCYLFKFYILNLIY
jgi:hypothetical protein